MLEPVSQSAYPLPRPNARVIAADRFALLQYQLLLATMAGLRFTLAGLATAALVILAYLAKSALGIDLLPGPSPLHDLLYPLIKG